MHDHAMSILLSTHNGYDDWWVLIGFFNQTDPYNGAKHEGVLGFIKGIKRGVLGYTLKSHFHQHNHFKLTHSTVQQ